MFLSRWMEELCFWALAMVSLRATHGVMANLEWVDVHRVHMEGHMLCVVCVEKKSSVGAVCQNVNGCCGTVRSMRVVGGCFVGAFGSVRKTQNAGLVSLFALGG